MRRAPLLSVLMIVALLAGCDLIERPPLEREFGAPYALLLDVPASDIVPGTPGVTPLLGERSGEMLAAVSYTGGCADHHFRLEYTLEADRALVWFFHADNADACDGLVHHLIRQPLPAAVLAKGDIVLLEPGNDETPLRPDRSSAAF